MKTIRTTIITALLLAELTAASAWAGNYKNLEFGGQIRLRGEATNIQSYTTPGLRRGDDFMLMRIRLNGSVEPVKGVKGFLQLQDSRTFGTNAGVAGNTANVDLHQGYIEVSDLWEKPLSLTVGRMELKYGDQRLISPLDWSNVGRAWDGIKVRVADGNWSADLFATTIVDNADAKRDQVFSGLYTSCKAIDRHEVDLYLLARDFNDGLQTSEHGPTGNLAERTVGTRFKGKTGRFDYSGEAAWQFGRQARQRIRAWGSALTAGYTFDHAWNPRLGVEYDFASGDSDPADNEVQTFNPLYPFGHAYQGFQDIFAWRNGHDIKGTISASPVEGLKAIVDFHHFQLHHSRDSWYGAGGAIARDATGTSSKDIGHEIDIHFKTKFRGAVNLWFGYSHFWAGRFVRNTTTVKDRDWAFLQATLNF